MAMTTVIYSIIWILLSYLLGSLPVGILLSRIKGKDPRTGGSGNIGATNVMRTAGKTMGIATLLGDALKGFLPVWLAIYYGLPEPIIAAIAFAAFLGHLFPLYLKFKGGKGVATALGIFLAFNYFAVLVGIVVFLGIILVWRYVSLGSLVAAVLMPAIFFLLNMPGLYVVLALCIALFTCIKHKDNIRRLWSGNENRIEGSRPT
jgi:acyl phosphate:glycerol-3-phosphate acyltransferase